MSGTDDHAQPALAKWLARLTGGQRALVAMATGAIGTLGFAPLFAWPFFVLSAAGLLVLLDGAVRRPKPLQAAFSRAFYWGFGHFLLGLHWVGAAFLQVDDGAALLAPFGVLGLSAGMALFVGLGALAAVPLWTTDMRRLAVFAVAMTGAELVRGHLFGGFPWNLAGYIWPAGGQISQIAAYVGIYGLSALTWLLAATPAALLDTKQGWLSRLGPMLLAALGLGIAFGAGYQRLQGAPVAQPGESPVVRVADSGLTQRQKNAPNPDQEFQVLDRLLAESGTPRDSNAAIVLWPEGAIPVVNFFAFQRRIEGDQERFVEPASYGDRMMQDMGPVLGDRVLITGATTIRPGPDAPEYFNSALIIDSSAGNAAVFAAYDKHRLVPFGEFLPFWELYSDVPLAPLQNIGKGFTPGPRPGRLVVPSENADFVQLLICYEGIFPGFTPREERPGWLASLTNDAWFSYGIDWLPVVGPAQHYNQTRYRAIEEGLPLARAAAGGTGAVVDAFGRPVAETRPGRLHAEAQLPAKLEPTVFVRFGWLTLAGLMALLLGLRFAPPGAPARGLRS